MSMKKKCLIVSVILLFIGVAIAPSTNFSIVKASNDNDLVEVTTQACGINGFGNTTVKLTRQQYQNLEQYLVGFRARLNQTTTREEAVPIFKDAIVELNRYGLLPRGMSVEQAQKLVTGRYQKTGLYHLIEKTFFRNQMNNSNYSNYLCLVCSVIDDMVSVGPVVRWINNYMYLVSETDYTIKWPVLAKIMVFLLSYPWMFGWFITSLNPFKVLYTLTLGSEYFNIETQDYEYHSANGWVATFGLNGIRFIQYQPLWGHLPLFPIRTFYGPGSYTYPGIFGYTGIGIYNRAVVFYLGSALWVEIGSEHPVLP
jgi:hypothetical protein